MGKTYNRIKYIVDTDTLMRLIEELQETKVDKVPGMQLSQEDFTKEYKILMDALVNHEEDIYIEENGEYSILGYKTAHISVPTSIISQAVIVNPTTSTQEILPDSAHNSLSKVTVLGVTSAIDSNIVSDNIVEGVSILGVTGNLPTEETIMEILYETSYGTDGE